MRQVTGCQEFPQGNFLSWENNNWFLNSTKVKHSTKVNTCICIVLVYKYNIFVFILPNLGIGSDGCDVPAECHH